MIPACTSTPAAIDRFEQRFPTVTAACRAAGIDPTRQPIPVVPGAHYSCGGVVTDVHGRTELPGLFAAGEVARTGMHGANRLASNSLLEGLVVGARAGKAAAAHAVELGHTRARLPELPRHPALDRGELQRAMTRDASVVRDAAGLGRLGDLLATAPERDAGTRGQFEDVGADRHGRARSSRRRAAAPRAAAPITAPISRTPTRCRPAARSCGSRTGRAVVQVPAAVC